MPNYILKLILKNIGQQWNADDLLEWTMYVPYAKEKDYIIKVAHELNYGK